MRVFNSISARRSSQPFAASPACRPTLLLGLLAALGPGLAAAHGAAVVAHRVAALEVRGELPPPRAAVTSLKFGDFFRMPIGPFGLEPSEKLLALNGKPVRLVGYMVREELPVPGSFLFAPLPVTLGDADESLSDDLPPTTVAVHLAGPGRRRAPYVVGLIRLEGTLEVGTRDEADARLSAVRLILDPQVSHRILHAKPALRAAAR